MTTTKKTAAAIGAAVLGIVLTAVSGHAWAGTRASLTFSGAVALPNGNIPAGTYVFEVMNPESGGNIVSVRSKNHAYYMGFTNRVERPRGMREDRLITLGESARGVAPPVLAWYPRGESHGYQFIYR